MSGSTDPKFVTVVVRHKQGRGVFLAYLDFEPDNTKKTFWSLPGGIFHVDEEENLLRAVAARVTQQTGIEPQLQAIPLYEDDRRRTYLAESFTGSLGIAPVVDDLAAEDVESVPQPSSKWAGFMELLQGPDADYNYEVLRALKVREGR